MKLCERFGFEEKFHGGMQNTCSNFRESWKWNHSRVEVFNIRSSWQQNSPNHKHWTNQLTWKRIRCHHRGTSRVDGNVLLQPKNLFGRFCEVYRLNISVVFQAQVFWEIAVFRHGNIRSFVSRESSSSQYFQLFFCVHQKSFKLGASMVDENILLRKQKSLKRKSLIHYFWASLRAFLLKERNFFAFCIPCFEEDLLFLPDFAMTQFWSFNAYGMSMKSLECFWNAYWFWILLNFSRR